MSNEAPTNSPPASDTSALTASVNELTAQLQAQRDANLAERAANDPRVAAAWNGLTDDQLKAEKGAREKAGLPTDQIDKVLAGRNVTQVDPAIARDIAAHGVHQAPTPADYKSAELGRLKDGLPPERITAIQDASADFAGKLQMSPEMGRAVIERIATLGAQFKTTDVQAWATNAVRQGLQSMGVQYRNSVPTAEDTKLAAEILKVDAREVTKIESLGAKDYRDLREAAKEVLQKAPGEISDALVKSPMLADLWLMKTLVIQGHARNLVARKYPGSK